MYALFILCVSYVLWNGFSLLFSFKGEEKVREIVVEEYGEYKKKQMHVHCTYYTQSVIKL